MKKRSVTNYRVMGSVVVDRIKSQGPPVALKAPLKAFNQVHAELESATLAAEAMRSARDEAIAAIGAADDALDASVQKLADALVGAGMGTRSNPLAGFSPHTPSALTSLAYAKEAKAVQALVAKLGKKANANAHVKKAAASCAKGATAVEAALARLTRPQTAYQKALAKRDALLVDWTKALGTLKKHAAVVWDDDQAIYDAAFAAPDAVQAPVRARRRKGAPVEPTPAG